MLSRSAFVLTVLFTGLASAAMPGRLHVNGVLTDSADRLVEGERNIRFALYSVEEGGEPFFTETLPVLLHKGAFFAELGGTKLLDLDALVDSRAGVWLGVGIEEAPEMSPRIRMGAVPLAAYAHRAGSAALADDATHAGSADNATLAARATVAANAEQLGGLAPDAYRQVSDPVPFSAIEGAPAGLADGDDDLFATLQCAAGQTAIFTDEGWTCARPFAGKACAPGFVASGVDANGELVCVADKDTDTNTTYSGADFALSNQACPAGHVYRGIDASGAQICIADKDTNTTYTAGSWLRLAGNRFELTSKGCSPGWVLKSNGDETWSCQRDNDTDTNTTYSGANFALSNRSCPSGEVMTGISSSGTPVCSKTVLRDYVNANCQLYAGWRDNCTSSTCNTPTRYVKVGGTGASSCYGSNGCVTISTMGGSSIQVGKMNLGGGVDENDRLFFAMKCY